MALSPSQFFSQLQFAFAGQGIVPVVRALRPWGRALRLWGLSLHPRSRALRPWGWALCRGARHCAHEAEDQGTTPKDQGIVPVEMGIAPIEHSEGAHSGNCRPVWYFYVYVYVCMLIKRWSPWWRPTQGSRTTSTVCWV